MPALLPGPGVVNSQRTGGSITVDQSVLDLDHSSAARSRAGPSISALARHLWPRSGLIAMFV